MIKNILSFIKDKRDYYLFLQKLQFFIVARFLLLVMPIYFFITSDMYKNFIGRCVEKYLIWKYGSISNLDYIPVVEKMHLIENVVYGGVFFGYVSVLIAYLYSQIYVFRNITSKTYAIKRTGKISDDIGFSVTFLSLLFIYNYPLQLLFDSWLYKLITVYFVYNALCGILFKTKAYGYSAYKRHKPLKT